MLALREKCLNTAFFLVHIFPYSVQMRKIQTRKTPYLGTFYTACELVSNRKINFVYFCLTISAAYFETLTGQYLRFIFT